MLPPARRCLVSSPLRFPLIAKIAQIESVLQDRKLQNKQHISVPFHFKNAKIIACFHHLSDLITASFRESTGKKPSPHCSAAPRSAAARTRGHGVWHRLRVGLEERQPENYPCFKLAITAMDSQNLFFFKKENSFKDHSTKLNPSVASVGQRVHEVLHMSEPVGKEAGLPCTPGTRTRCYTYHLSPLQRPSPWATAVRSAWLWPFMFTWSCRQSHGGSCQLPCFRVKVECGQHVGVGTAGELQAQPILAS